MLQRFKVLVAVKPASLFRVIEHLLDRPGIQVIAYAGPEDLFTRQAHITNPDLIIIGSRYFADGGVSVTNDLKHSRRRAKLVMIGSFAECGGRGVNRDVDGFLCDENLVDELDRTVRALLSRKPV